MVMRRPPQDFVCEYCGNPFKKHVHPSSPTFHFCSLICSNKARTKPKITEPKIPCPRCGAPFFPASYGKRGKQKYCSHECGSPKTPKHIADAVAETYPKNGAEPLMKQFGLSRSVIYSIAYRQGIKLHPDVRKRTRSETARKRMKTNNPMKQPEVQAKVVAWQKAHPKFRAARNARLIHAKSKYQRENPSGLERKLWQILDALGIEYEASAVIKPKFVVDIRIGKLILQADGGYWHGDPRRFKTLTKRQKAQQKRDKAQDAYLRKCGYTVVRIWELDMSPQLVKSILKEHNVISS